MQPDLTGKTVVLTGATAGIGRATALGLAGLGARLVGVGRDPARIEETLGLLEEAGAADRATILRADVSSLEDVRRLAGEVLERCPAIHVLVNNAGVTVTRRTTTVDGYETTFAVNHLAYYELTAQLLPRIVASAPARIVSVASEAHRFGRIDLDDLQNERSYRGLRVYGQSKTANILFTRELARRLAGTGVTANCLHPGAIRSNLGRGNGPILDGVQRIVGLFLKSPEQGARTSIHLAASPDVATTSGAYFADCKARKPAAHATDAATAHALWEATERMTETRYPDLARAARDTEAP